MLENKKPNGIILCGGKSKRMGQNKALLKLGQFTVIEHVIHTLSQICDEIIISTNNHNLDFLGYQVINDKLNDIGPIAGFYSTLSVTNNEHNIIVSCDTPFINAGLLSYLYGCKENFDLVLPIFKNQLQPMMGYFRKSYFKIIEKEIDDGNRKPINIFENSNLRVLDINPELNFYNQHLFFNINSPEDYEQAKIIYRDIS